MEEILVIGNPSRRRRKSRRKAHRKARRASRRTMSPLQKMYFGGGARSNPSRRRRSSRRRSRGMLNLGAGKLSIGSALRSPVATLKPAAIGAVGAIAVNTAMGRILPMIPGAPAFMAGRMRYVTQVMGALALAGLASKLRVIGPSTAAKMAEGSLTVTMVDVIRDFAGQAGINLAGMGYYLPGYGVNATAPVPGGAARPARLAGVGQYLTGPGAGSVLPFKRSNMNGMRGRPYGTASFNKGF